MYHGTEVYRYTYVICYTFSAGAGFLLIVRLFKALDCIKSREIADERLLLIDFLAKYHVHRRELKHCDNALVYSLDSD